MDQDLLHFFYNLATSSSELRALTFFLAEYFGYFVSVMVLMWIVWRFRESFVQKVIVAFGGSVFAWILAHVLKDYFTLPRPFQVLEGITPLVQGGDIFQSFPSGHATLFAALAVSTYFLDKRVGMVVGACAVIIGLARIMAGIHWPSDILSGWILGTLVAIIVNALWLYTVREKGGSRS